MKNLTYDKTLSASEIDRAFNGKTGRLIFTGQNRKNRRANMQKERFHGNSSGIHLTVLGTTKFYRIKQKIKESLKHAARIIEHYIQARR